MKPAPSAGFCPKRTGYRWLAAVGLIALGACQGTREPASPSRDDSQPLAAPPVRFTDVTEQCGIDFVHRNGAQGAKQLPESMGGGAAFLDYDNDGRTDLLLVHSAPATSADVSSLRLYRNTASGFEDVTRAAGLVVDAVGMGLACGDYDNDGWVDVYLSALGRNRLFHNVAGQFHEVTTAANVGGDSRAWSTSCGWFDFDQDSDLDLFVGNYLNWAPEYEVEIRCQLPAGLPAYCPPTAFDGAWPYLFRNEGDGTFTEIAAQAGLCLRNPRGRPLSKSLGVLPIDLNDDGWLDLVVANDTERNFAFLNRRDGTFHEVGVPAGVAFDDGGNTRGAMGIDGADFRNDGSLGLAIGNFSDEMVAVYVARADSLQFSDQAVPLGIGGPTRDALTFGLLWLDYDSDSFADLLVVNGHLEPDIRHAVRRQRYAQSPQLFWNATARQTPSMIPVTQGESGAELFEPIVGRGATYADWDLDGDLDVLLASCGGRPRLLQNEQQLGHHYLRLRLIGTAGNRDAIGSWVEVDLGTHRVRRRVMPTRSYLSQVELPLTIGLGRDPRIESVSIHWSDGTVQTLADPRRDSLRVVVQPIPAPSPPSVGPVAQEDL